MEPLQVGSSAFAALPSGPVRGAESPRQQSNPPCGSGFHKDVPVALGTVIVISVCVLLVAVTLGCVHPYPRETSTQKSEHFKNWGALLP